MVGEALAYVQGFGLKANAVVCRRLTNSPAARGKLWWPISLVDGAAMPDQVRETAKKSGFPYSILGVGIATAEALGLLFALVLLLSINVSLVLWLSLAVFLVSAFVLVTGRPIPRIRSRGKGFVFASVAGIYLMASATIYQEQREEYLTALRSADPDAYLAELERVDETRWLAELQALRPEQYEAEMRRRDLAEQAERERECTDRRLGEAYVMIQNDVRQSLHSPATAEFPARYALGTQHEGDCVYRIVGQLDAQNRFGALLRTSFEGRITYFPETQSWRTIELAVEG